MQRWRSFAFILTGLLLILAFPIYSVKVFNKTDYTDFSVYYRAADRFQHGLWAEIYTLTDGASPFRYPPLLLPLFLPFSYLSPEMARLSWYFLQWCWFGFGFFLLRKTLAQISGPNANWVTCLSIVAIFRLCLDTFTIGQVSSLMFLGFCMGIYGWIHSRPRLAGTGLLIPTLFKIGPGVLYPLLLASNRMPRKSRALLFPLALTMALCLSLWAWVGTDCFLDLWRRWFEIVRLDSTYYDSSHYGSQSLYSVLLRLAKTGLFSLGMAEKAHFATTIVGCAALFSFWLFRTPQSPLGQGAFFSLGLFAYLWFMPETFKYSLTPIAIPVAFLLISPRRPRLTWVALGSVVLFISAAAKDILPDSIFFGIQTLSFPWLATMLLFAAVLSLAMHESAASNFFPKKLGPWPHTPQEKSTLRTSVLIPVPLEKEPNLDFGAFDARFREAYSSLCESDLENFEILFIPYGDCNQGTHPAMKWVSKYPPYYPGTRIIPKTDIPGRGAALRDGFLASYGETIFIWQMEQPCDFLFFENARPLLDSGYDLVRANRRLPESRFRIPVRYLPFVYGRHRLGLWFNHVVRILLPIFTTDTHSGIFAIRRKTAFKIFTFANSADFLFDLEIALVSKAHGFKEADLPVTLFLAREKRSVRMLQEFFIILLGLPGLARRYRSKCYHPSIIPNGITADDWGLSPGINRGILELAQNGIVQRVSILANCPYIRTHFEEVRDLPGVQFGLHFNLTHGKLLTPIPTGGEGKRSPSWFLARWVRALFLGRREEWAEFVRNELDAQLKRLLSLGIPVSYLDGHHHIHLVPGLLDAIAPILKENGIREVRLPYDPALLWSSKVPLLLLCWVAKPAFRRNGFQSLPCFYPQKRHFMDHGLIRARLSKDPRTEVIVHPARINDLDLLDDPDPYDVGRIQEFKSLSMLRRLST